MIGIRARCALSGAFLSRIARRVALCSIAPLRRPCRKSRHRRPPVSSRSFDDFSRSVRFSGPAFRKPEPAGPGRLHRRDLRQCAAAVFGAAAVHQDGAAAARRLAGGVVGGDGVLPVAAARRLCLCAFSDAAPQPRDSRGDPSGAARGRDADAAAVDLERVGRSADFGLCVLAARPVCGVDRAAVLRARRQQSAAAGLVRPHRPPQRPRSVLPLCFLEHRQLPGAVVLSGAAGADVHAAHAEPDLDRRLWPADRADRNLRRPAAALAGECGKAEHAGRRYRRAGAVMDFARPLDIPCRRAVGAADRGDRAYFHRRRRRAAAVGAAAVALSLDLGAGVPVAAAAAAQMDAAGAAAGDRRRRRAAGVRRRAEFAADARRASALLLRHRDGLPWRTGAHPPGGEISHRLLCRAVVRRHGRRLVRRPDRAVHLLLDRGISDPAGAGGAVPAARRRAAAALEPLVLAVPRRAGGGADRADLVAPANCSLGSTPTGSG